MSSSARGGPRLPGGAGRCAAVRFGILGPLEVTEGEATRGVGRSQGAYPAGCAAGQGERGRACAPAGVDPVARGRAGRGGQQPPHPVSRLRNALGGDAVERTESGYVVRCGEDELGALAFEQASGRGPGRAGRRPLVRMPPARRPRRWPGGGATRPCPSSRTSPSPCPGPVRSARSAGARSSAASTPAWRWASTGPWWASWVTWSSASRCGSGCGASSCGRCTAVVARPRPSGRTSGCVRSWRTSSASPPVPSWSAWSGRSSPRTRGSTGRRRCRRRRRARPHQHAGHLPVHRRRALHGPLGPRPHGHGRRAAGPRRAGPGRHREPPRPRLRAPRRRLLRGVHRPGRRGACRPRRPAPPERAGAGPAARSTCAWRCTPARPSSARATTSAPP